MKYLSVCSGIEAASVAWESLGWQPLAFSEIEAFPRAVLEHHYPGVPLHGDFTVLRHEPWIADADVLVGGTPCQAFSVAGLRNSLADDRGNLSLEFIRLADAIDAAREAQGRDPSVVVWENVPGVLSVKDNAFGCFLAALAGDVEPYVPPRGKWTNAGVVDGPQRQVAWRILDAQYFGLAQRRRRVFVVASARAGFDPAAVLLEFEGVRRDSAPRRETGQGTAARFENGPAVDFRHEQLTGDTAHTLQSKATGGYSLNYMPGVLQAVPSTGDISHCLNAGGMGRQDYETETLVTHALRGEGFDASEDGTGRGTAELGGDIQNALRASQGGGDKPHVLAPTVYSIMPQNSGKDYKARPVEVAQPIMAGGPVGGNQGGDYVQQHMAVRRLTPVECERLQGFPDDYTMIPWKKKPADQCPDGPRYKALGNSMAVPVMRWIGRRIAEALR